MTEPINYIARHLRIEGGPNKRKIVHLCPTEGEGGWLMWTCWNVEHPFICDYCGMTYIKYKNFVKLYLKMNP